MLLKDNSKLFLNVLFVLDFPSNAKFIIPNSQVYNEYDVLNSNYFAYGIGYKHNEKYSLEFRYYNALELIKSEFWGSKYQSMSLVFGYTLF